MTNPIPFAAPTSRPDFAYIARWVKPGAKVLDLGCGDGSLLRYLRETRRAHGYGVEIDFDSLVECIGNGINVVQNDLETGLAMFESGSFDCVILSQTLQAMRNIRGLMRDMLRVGGEAIVSFPNFRYEPHFRQLDAGRMPVSQTLPYQWHDTPNVHLCTLLDFEDLCAELGLRVVERVALAEGQPVESDPNTRSELAIYRVSV